MKIEIWNDTRSGNLRIFSSLNSGLVCSSNLEKGIIRITFFSKLRHYANKKILFNLYYSLFHPFLIYGLLAWGNTYRTTLLFLSMLFYKYFPMLVNHKLEKDKSMNSKDLIVFFY